MDQPPAQARRMWRLFEPVHAVTYFSPVARAAFEEAGLRGFWRGYCAGRAAPLGAVGPATVTALFFGFAPGMVARALPDVWSRATPQQALDARLDGAGRALHVAEEAVGPATVAAAADLAWAAAQEVDCAGRALGAANAALPDPGWPLGRLWLATTVLREHRGDGHVAALVGAGIDGAESLVLRAGHDLDRAALQPARGWTDDEWDAAGGRLADRGWLLPDGTATAAGRAVVADVEHRTDVLATRPWRRLGAATAERLAEAMTPIAAAVASVLPYPNPIGLPAPAPPMSTT